MKRLIAILVLGLIASIVFSQDVPKGAMMLGERRVDFHADHDVIRVGPVEGWFKDIVVFVEKNNIEIFNLVVTYGNGERQQFDTRLNFGADSRSRSLPLEGGKRRIRTIAFTYRTVGNWLDGRARVVVYGVH